MPSTATNRLQGLTTSVAVKPPCITVATTNITLSGLQTISGVTVTEGDRVLVKGQSTAADNGIYNASTGAWTRALDFDGDLDAVSGTRVLVRSGSSSAIEYELTTADPIVIGTTALTFTLRYGANATYDSTEAEVIAGVTVVDASYPPGYADRFGANTTPGTTDMTSALVNWAKSATTGLEMNLAPGGTYVFDPSAVTNGILFSGKSGFKVNGNGATIICKAGASVVAQHEMMRFNNCSDFYVENLTIDANRDARTPVESTSHTINIGQGCLRGHFKKVRAINATTDNWYIGSDTQGTPSTYPTEIVLEDCDGVNAYRSNCSFIVSTRCRVIGGSYKDANGHLPETGIDVEPDNIAGSSGNTDLTLMPEFVTGNGTAGIVVTGVDATPNTRIKIARTRLSGNGKIAVHVAQAVGGVEINDLWIGDHAGDASFGLVQIGGSGLTVNKARVSRVRFEDVTSTTAAACLYIHSATTGVTDINDVGFHNIACRGILAGATVMANDIHINTCTSTNPAIQSVAMQSVFRDIYTDTTTAAGIYVTGADNEIDGATIIDYGASASAGIQFEPGATGSITKNISFQQRTSIPGGTSGIRYNGVAPRIIEDITGKSAGTDFTTANIVTFLSGISGSRIRGISPSLQVLTGAGAIDLAAEITHLVTTGANAITLADGGEGQQKLIVMKTDAGDGTLTPSNLANGTTLSFNDVDDFARLTFTNGQWYFTGTATLA